jgi:hypothetical protein
MNKNEIIEKIFQTIQGWRFEAWYNTGNLHNYVTGETDVSAEQVKEDIARLFHLDGNK